MQPEPLPSGGQEPTTPWRRSLRVIGREHFRDLVDRALTRALEAEPAVGEALAKRIRAAVQRELPGLLRRHGRAVRAVPKTGFLIELQRSTHDLLAKRDEVRGELAELAEKVHLSRLLAEQDARQKMKLEHRADVERLERRIDKLRRLLDDTEGQLGLALGQRSGEIGIASIFRTVQGLADDEAQRELKRVLLMEIFQANLELRRPAS